jgi:four helix bundle protein
MQNATDRSNTLQHERLDAFTVAVQLEGPVVAIARRAGRGHAWLADQAMRASASVVLNLAEALGREGADRVRALRIARGSALELDAALTLMLHRGACRAAERQAAKALNVRAVAMLTGAHPMPPPFGPSAAQPVLFANPGEWSRGCGIGRRRERAALDPLGDDASESVCGRCYRMPQVRIADAADGGPGGARAGGPSQHAAEGDPGLPRLRGGEASATLNPISPGITEIREHGQS